MSSNGNDASNQALRESDPSADPRAVWLFQSEVAGTLAMWAIRQSPYRCPDNLQVVVEALSEMWPSEIAGMSQWNSLEAIERELQEISEAIPELLAWNKPKSRHSDPFVFSSRYDQPAADDDFIDLHALWRNTATSLWSEAEPASAAYQDAPVEPQP